jgi:methionyl-tRNA formyltransferase
MSILPSCQSKSYQTTCQPHDLKLTLASFRGAAPLHHTLLAGRTHTGITLQTLHPKKFDNGRILLQTPLPGLKIHNPTNCTIPDLLGMLSPEGANMLLQGIRERVFIPPLTDKGWYRGDQETVDFPHAPKVTPEDRHIDWTSWNAEKILRRQRVLGRLWNFASPSLDEAVPDAQPIRVVLHQIHGGTESSEQSSLLPGIPYDTKLASVHSHDCDLKSTTTTLSVNTCDGKRVFIDNVTVEGFRTQDAIEAARRSHLISENGYFHKPLQ